MKMHSHVNVRNTGAMQIYSIHHSTMYHWRQTTLRVQSIVTFAPLRFGTCLILPLAFSNLLKLICATGSTPPLRITPQVCDFIRGNPSLFSQWLCSILNLHLITFHSFLANIFGIEPVSVFVLLCVFDLHSWSSWVSHNGDVMSRY